MDSGPPGWFVAWAVFVVIIAIVGFFVRISIARNLARRTGIDEDAAVKAEIFGTGAITSMYLQAHRHDADGEYRGDVAPDDPGHVVAELPTFPRHEG